MQVGAWRCLSPARCNLGSTRPLDCRDASGEGAGCTVVIAAVPSRLVVVANKMSLIGVGGQKKVFWNLHGACQVVGGVGCLCARSHHISTAVAGGPELP